MDEATLCERVALIQGGKIMEINTPQGIVDEFKKSLFAIKSNDIYKLISDLRDNFKLNYVYPFGQYVHLSDASGTVSEDSINNILINLHHKNIEIKQVKPNIEDCFMDLMRR